MFALDLENCVQNLQRKTKGFHLENALSLRVFGAQQTNDCCYPPYMDMKYVCMKYGGVVVHL